MNFEKLAEEIANSIVLGDDAIGGFENRTYHRALERLRKVFEATKETITSHVFYADLECKKCECGHIPLKVVNEYVRSLKPEDLKQEG